MYLKFIHTQHDTKIHEVLRMITPTIFLQVFYSPRWKTGRYILQCNLNHFWIWDYLQLL